jgi:hypothetical protein
MVGDGGAVTAGAGTRLAAATGVAPMTIRGVTSAAGVGDSDAGLAVAAAWFVAFGIARTGDATPVLAGARLKGDEARATAITAGIATTRIARTLSDRMGTFVVG